MASTTEAVDHTVVHVDYESLAAAFSKLLVDTEFASGRIVLGFGVATIILLILTYMMVLHLWIVKLCEMCNGKGAAGILPAYRGYKLVQAQEKKGTI